LSKVQIIIKIQQEAISTTTISNDWEGWKWLKTGEGKSNPRICVLNRRLWEDLEFICAFTKAIVKAIRYLHTDFPSLGEIYETMDGIIAN
jgi:hypothetical protein